MTLSAFIAVLISVESGGNDWVPGDKGKAVGALQIHRGVVEDVNRFAGTRFTHRDMHRRDVAIYCATVYLTHYCTKERLGHVPTAEDFARVWNGGPDGWKEPATIRYWKRVQPKLK